MYQIKKYEIQEIQELSDYKFCPYSKLQKPMSRKKSKTDTKVIYSSIQTCLNADGIDAHFSELLTSP